MDGQSDMGTEELTLSEDQALVRRTTLEELRLKQRRLEEKEMGYSAEGRANRGVINSIIDELEGMEGGVRGRST